jgi:tetratricopeptide (TPR) repeat protein
MRSSAFLKTQKKKEDGANCMKLVFASVALLGLIASPARADKKLDEAVAKAEDQVAKGKPEDAVKTLQKAATQTPGSEGQVALGNLQAKLGNFDEATAAYAKAKELSATEPAATKAASLSAVASYHLAVGTAKDALAAASAAAEAQPTPESLSALARAQVRSNDVPAAQKTVEKALAAGASNALAHEAQGVVQASMGLVADSIASFRKAVELDPKLTRARAELASALATSGKGTEAAAEAKKATEADPKSGEAFAALGQALLAENSKNWNEAIAQAQQGAFLNPKSPIIQTTVGKIFEGNGNFEQAVSSYKKALETDPSYSPARLALVKVQDLQGDRKGALAEARKLATEMPNNGEAQFLVGRALMRANDYAAAMPVLEKAASLTPGNAEAHALLATAAFFTGKNDQAVAFYKKALDLKPDNVSWRTDYGLFLARNGDLDAAATELKRVVATPGYKDAAGYVNLGYVYRNMKPPKLDDSILAYKKALELDPKEEQAALGLAWSYLTAQKYDESIAAYTKAAQMEPKLAADAYNGIGWSYFFKKDMAQAKASAAKAKEAGRLDGRLVEQIDRFEKAVAAGGADTEKAMAEAIKAREAASKVDSMQENLRSKSGATRSRALRDLVTVLAPAEAVQQLVYYLANDKDWAVRQTAATLLGGLGPAARPALPYLKQYTAPCLDTINATKEQLEESMLCGDLRGIAIQAIAKISK